VHGATLAAHAGISEIIIPPASGVFSALGLLFARIQHRLVAVCWYDIDKADCAVLNARAETLFEEAAAMMAGEGVALDRSELQFTLDLRYAGQSSELGIAVKERVLTPAVLAAAAAQFHVEHDRTYGYCNPTERVQVVNLRLRARSLERWDHVPSPSALKRRPSGASVARPVYFGPGSGWVTTKVIRRQDLTQKPQFGPLIVEEYDTTIIVPPDAQVHAIAGTVRIRLKGDV
jgi:N-methylhydantoinase A